MQKLVVSSLFALLAFPLFAAPMSRVVAIVNSHTVVVEQGGVRTTVQLTGVALPADAEERAVAFLNAEVLFRFVLVDVTPTGTFLYRSPDALAINRAVAATWSDAPTQHPGTLLGTSAPGGHVTAPAKPQGPLQPLATYAPSAAPRRAPAHRTPRRQ